jgi:hypothetical protein
LAAQIYEGTVFDVDLWAALHTIVAVCCAAVVLFAAARAHNAHAGPHAAVAMAWALGTVTDLLTGAALSGSALPLRAAGAVLLAVSLIGVLLTTLVVLLRPSLRDRPPAEEQCCCGGCCGCCGSSADTALVVVSVFVLVVGAALALSNASGALSPLPPQMWFTFQHRSVQPATVAPPALAALLPPVVYCTLVLCAIIGTVRRRPPSMPAVPPLPAADPAF